MATAKKILGLTFLLTGTVLWIIGAWMVLSPGQYKATTRVQLASTDTISALGQPPGAADAYDPYFIQTEFARMQSEIVLTNVIARLHLDEAWGNKHSSRHRLSLADTLERLKQGMEFKPVRNTKLIEISFYSTNPKEAADVANAIAAAYDDFRVQLWKTNTAVGIKALEDEHQKDEQKIKIERTKLEIPKASMVQIVDAAQPPKYPARPNRFLGIIVFVIGMTMSGVGFWLLRPARQSTS